MISVIVPVYNVAAYLPRCLKSLEKQTEQDIEFIIVNDGSTDGSDKICREFIRGKDKFRYFCKENGGLMSAWMEGVKHVRGDYVGFVDSDDYVDETMFSVLYERAKAHNNIDIVMCKFLYEHIENGNIISQFLQNNSIEEGYYSCESFKSIKKKILPRFATNYISPSRCNKIIKTELLKRNMKYCDLFISSGEDVNIIVPCFWAAESFCYIDKAMYHYIKNTNSISHNYKETLQEQYIRLLSRLKTATVEYEIAVNNEEWARVINFYGMMLLRMILNSSLSRKEKKEKIQKLCRDSMFIEGASNVQTAACNKWERAYIYSLKKENANSFSWLLFLSKLKNKLKGN